MHSMMCGVGRGAFESGTKIVTSLNDGSLSGELECAASGDDDDGDASLESSGESLCVRDDLPIGTGSDDDDAAAAAGDGDATAAAAASSAAELVTASRCSDDFFVSDELRDVDGDGSALALGRLTRVFFFLERGVSSSSSGVVVVLVVLVVLVVVVAVGVLGVSAGNLASMTRTW
jgi:hypothetical protein